MLCFLLAIPILHSRGEDLPGLKENSLTSLLLNPSLRKKSAGTRARKEAWQSVKEATPIMLDELGGDYQVRCSFGLPGFYFMHYETVFAYEKPSNNEQCKLQSIYQ